MHDSPAFADLVVRVTGAYGNSALPNAPVVPEPAPRLHRRILTHVTTSLRRIVSALEPAEHRDEYRLRRLTVCRQVAEPRRCPRGT